MWRTLRSNALCALSAGAGAATLGWLGLYGFAWNDYEVEAQPAFEALAHGHLQRFLELAPAYGGSLVERAPFALLPGLWGGGQLAVYRLVALPCLLVAAAFAVWIAARMRAEGRSLLARGVTVGLCVANPVALLGIETGHPEELLGACLCAAALLGISRSEVDRRQALVSGTMLGLAIANKESAVLALGPVLLAAPPGRRLTLLLSTVAVAGLVEAPLVIGSGGGALGRAGSTVTPGASIFQPWQVWWFFGRHGTVVHGTLGAVKPGYRAGPAWTSTISHPLILLCGALLPLAACGGAVRRRLAPERAALLLTLVLLLRCMLDIWNTSYYMLPALLAMLAWETLASHRPPVMTLLFTIAIWAGAEWVPPSPDVQAAVFVAWTTPLAAVLAVRLFAPGALHGGARRSAGGPGILSRGPSAPWAGA